MNSNKKRKAPVQVPEISSTTKSSDNGQKASDSTSISVPTFYDHDPLNRKSPIIKFGVVEKRGNDETAEDQDVSKWYSLQFSEVQELENDAELIRKAISYADKCLQTESKLYHEARSKQKPNDVKWMKTVLSGGTLADQVAALTLTIQESPPHNHHNLQLLINKVTKHSRREALTAADALKELFVQELLPDRKLVPLKFRPLTDVEKLSSGNKDVRDRRLLLWYYENQLKELFENYVRNIEKWCYDTVEATRLRAIKILLDLLMAKPEQEQFLLSSLVNKLGDQSNKVASKMAYFLLQLVDEHPNMKPVVVNEIDRLVYRPNISPKAQHYAVCFLSQMTLKRSEDNLALRLVVIYFNLFKLMVKRDEKSGVDNKMLAILLKGTNRAFACCSKSEKRHEQILSGLDTVYKVAAVGNFNTSLQALMLLHQTLTTSTGLTDRYYSAVYRKLTDSTLHQSSGQKHYPLFFHLLHQVMGRDESDRRVLAFIKRLLQSALCSSATFAVAALMLLSNLFSKRPALRKLERKRQDVLSTIDDDDDEHFTDAHGADSDAEHGSVSDDDEEEIATKKRTPAASWVHRNNVGGHSRASRTTYDPWHRNPSFAAADTTLLYELGRLANHYHPTVALFANNLLQGIPVEYPGDPLEDFTLIRFLDRFVYRNPKKPKTKTETNADDDEMQNNRTVKRSVLMKKRKTYNPWGVKAMAVTCDGYVQKAEHEIPADEQYLHKFMTSMSRPNDKQKRKRGQRSADDDEGSDIESVASDEFEQLLTKFEPGAKNEEFNVDFTKDMDLGEKKKRKRNKDSDSEDDSSEDYEDLFAADPDD